MPETASDTLNDASRQKEPRTYLTTVAILTIMGSVFMVEVLTSTASGSDLSAELLTELGGLSRRLVLHEGQLWRFIVAPLLHGGFLHLFLNSLALFIVGPRLDGIIGPAWFSAIFAASCFSGGLFSVLINDPFTVSVGASGGIMGLLAAAFLVSFRLEASESRSSLQIDTARMLVPALMPALFIPIAGGSQDGIDVAAHFGGALAGFISGLYLLARDEEPAGLKQLYQRDRHGQN